MKSMKKFLAFALVLVMLTALSVTAFAATTITVTTTDPDDTQTNTRTYNYYKIFSASLVDPADATKGVSYYLNSPADDAKKTALEGLTGFTFTKSADGTRWVVTSTATDGEALATELKAIVEANTSLFPKSADFAAGAAQTVEDGYYLIVSNLGSKMILDTFQTQTIEEKNSYPTVKKVVDKAAAQIGDTLTYTLTVTVPATAVGTITLTDTLADSITYTAPAEGAKGTYSASGQVITITFSAAEVEAAKGSTLETSFTAVLNTDAVIGQKAGEITDSDTPGYATDGNFNKIYLTYAGFVTKEEGVDTDTYEAIIKKTDGSIALKGAEFTMARADGTAVKFTGQAGAYTVDPEGTVTTLQCDDAGQIDIKGLNTETYKLTETKAPEGYNPLTAPKDVAVVAGTTVLEVEVVNEAGTELPSTGGIGTTLFYVIGSVLVLGAGVVLVTKRRVRE